MSYVDGFVLPVPTENLEKYKEIASGAAKVWMDHGALAYYECKQEDAADNGFSQTFAKGANMKEGETAVFAFIIFKSRAHRDEVNAKVMADERLKCDPNDMPFDCARMMYGGFEAIVEQKA